jgi:protein-disulfide isomerase
MEQRIPDPLGEGGARANPSPADSNTITFKRTHFYSVLIPLAFVLGLSVGYLFWGRSPSTGGTVSDSPSASQSVAQVQNPEATPSFRRYEIDEDDDPVYGPETAEITIVEFSDYECPYCQKWHIEVLPRLLTDYSGQVRLVFRDFPLTNIHPNAIGAAVAANCAGEQNAYWEFNQALFTTQQGLNLSHFQDLANELNLDMDAFQTCMQDEAHAEEVQADLEYAVNLGVRSTPTFFINGIPVVGAQPYEVFSQIIDKEMAGEFPD